MLLKGARFSLLYRENMNALEVEPYFLFLPTGDSGRDKSWSFGLRRINFIGLVS